MIYVIVINPPDNPTTNARLALVWQYFKRLDIGKLLDRKFPMGKGGIANSDVTGHPPLPVQSSDDRGRQARQRDATPSVRDDAC